MRDWPHGQDRQRNERLVTQRSDLTASRGRSTTRLDTVVLFFEILLIAAVIVITWFALYTLYRLITDES